MPNTSVNTVNSIATATTPKFYSDSELSGKTQKQLIAIALEFGEVIEPSAAKKMKNAGLIAAIVDLQGLQSARTASLSSIDESIAVAAPSTTKRVVNVARSRSRNRRAK